MQTNMPSNLQANIEHVRHASDKYNTEYRYIWEAMTFNLTDRDNQLWNGMIIVLGANFSQVSATQTECWCKLNNEIQPKRSKGMFKTKGHKVMPTIK